MRFPRTPFFFSHSIASRLEQIPGVGPKRRKSVLMHFKTVEQLNNATLQEIASCEGVGESYARKIYAFLHPEGQ